MRGGLLAALLSLGLAAWAVNTAGGRPGSAPSGAARLGDPTGGGGVGAGPLPPRSPEQAGTAAGGLPQTPTQNRTRQGGRSGPIPAEAAAAGEARPADRLPTREPSGHMRSTSGHTSTSPLRSRRNNHSQPPKSSHRGNHKHKQRPEAPGQQRTPDPRPHTRGNSDSSHSPWQGMQKDTQPHTGATTWEVLVPPSQLRPVPHATTERSPQQPTAQQSAGPQPPQPAQQQSLAAIHSKPTALYRQVFQPGHRGGEHPPAAAHYTGAASSTGIRRPLAMAPTNGGANPAPTTTTTTTSATAARSDTGGHRAWALRYPAPYDPNTDPWHDDLDDPQPQQQPAGLSAGPAQQQQYPDRATFHEAFQQHPQAAHQPGHQPGGHQFYYQTVPREYYTAAHLAADLGMSRYSDDSSRTPLDSTHLPCHSQ